MIKPRTPDNRTPNRTPRSTNNYNNPQYTPNKYPPESNRSENNVNFNQSSNNFNNHNQVAPRTPQRGSMMSNSSASSTQQNADMVCINCINKHLMLQKQERDRVEKEKDQILRQIAESNYRNSAQKELERQKQLKDQYKNDANFHLEQIQNKKLHDEKVKRNFAQEQHNENQNNRNQDYERYQRLNQLQNELKMGLLKQIQEKETEKLYDRFNKDQYKTTLDIGNDYRPRSALPRNYGDDLREQILYKENLKLMEKDNDRKLAEAQKELDRKFNEDIQFKKHIMENQRKDDLKKAYQDYIQKKMEKMNYEENEKQNFNQSQKKLKDEMEKAELSNYMRRKEMEKNAGETLKNQIEYKNLLKQLERNEKNTPLNDNGLCQHRNKMISCSECNKSFPKQQMCKRADSPLKHTPKRF